MNGKNIGQFHYDFPEVENGTKGEIPVVIESIFLMKKMYVDKLTYSSGKVDYMMRGKGLTQELIKKAAEKMKAEQCTLIDNFTKSDQRIKYIYNVDGQEYTIRWNDWLNKKRPSRPHSKAAIGSQNRTKNGVRVDIHDKAALEDLS